MALVEAPTAQGPWARVTTLPEQPTARAGSLSTVKAPVLPAVAIEVLKASFARTWLGTQVIRPAPIEVLVNSGNYLLVLACEYTLKADRGISRRRRPPSLISASPEAPMSTSDPPAYQQPPLPPPRSWPGRHKILTAVGSGSVLLAVPIIVIAATSTPSVTKASTSAATAAAPAVTKTVQVTSPPKVIYVTSPASTPAPAPAQPAPAAPPAFTNASAVVDQFYQDITDGNFTAAWSLGGQYIGGSDYSQWVAGYSTTASISVGTESDFGSGQVRATIVATQDDGSVSTYEGTYTVTGGAITAASIVRTS